MSRTVGLGLVWGGAIVVGVVEWLSLPWKLALLTTGLLSIGLGIITALLHKWSRQTPAT